MLAARCAILDLTLPSRHAHSGYVPLFPCSDHMHPHFVETLPVLKKVQQTNGRNFEHSATLDASTLSHSNNPPHLFIPQRDQQPLCAIQWNDLQRHLYHTPGLIPRPWIRRNDLPAYQLHFTTRSARDQHHSPQRAKPKLKDIPTPRPPPTDGGASVSAAHHP